MLNVAVDCPFCIIICQTSKINSFFFLLFLIFKLFLNFNPICFSKGTFFLQRQVQFNKIDNDDDADDDDDDHDIENDDDNDDSPLTVLQFQGSPGYCHDDHQPSAPPDGRGHHCHLPRLPVQAVWSVSAVCNMFANRNI